MKKNRHKLQQEAEQEKRKAAQRAEDLEMMNSPRRWPQWPMLPMKRYEKGNRDTSVGLWIERGSAFAFGNKQQFIFYRGVNLFAVAAGQQNLEDFKPEEIEAEQLLSEGWVVD